MEKEELKRLVAVFMKRVYDCGLTTSTGGNISVRFDDVMLITPSGLDKASLSASDIAEVDIKTGKNLTMHLKLSIESLMHRMIYLKREDIGAVVHCHPVFSCLFSSAEEKIRTDLIAESYYLLNTVEKIPYALMGTSALAEAVSEHMRTSDAALLENHGAIAVGKTLLNAFDRIECLEQAAKMTVFSKGLTIKAMDYPKLLEIDGMKK